MDTFARCTFKASRTHTLSPTRRDASQTEPNRTESGAAGGSQRATLAAPTTTTASRRLPTPPTPLPFARPIYRASECSTAAIAPNILQVRRVATARAQRTCTHMRRSALRFGRRSDRRRRLRRLLDSNSDSDSNSNSESNSNSSSDFGCVYLAAGKFDALARSLARN